MKTINVGERMNVFEISPLSNHMWRVNFFEAYDENEQSTANGSGHLE